MYPFLKKLGISTFEIPRVKFIWSLRFLFQIGFIFAWTTVTATFIGIFGIENILKLLLIDAGILLIGSLFCNYIFLKIPQNDFLLMMLGGTVALTFCAIFFEHNPVLYFIFALLAKDFFFAQLGIGIIRKNESLFSPSEAMRVMPLLETASTIGTVVAALLFLMALEIFPLEKAFQFWIIPLILMFFLVFFGSKMLHEIPQFQKEKIQKNPVKEPKNNFIASVSSAIEKEPFLKFMLLIIFTQAVLGSIIEVEFLKSVQSHANPETHTLEMKTGLSAKNLSANLLKNSVESIKEVSHTVIESAKEISREIFVHETLAHDLGLLSLIFGSIALLVQIFMTRVVLRRLGLFGTMAVYGLGFLVTIFLVLLGNGGMTLIRGFQHGFHSLFETPYHLSFYSIFSHQRERMRHFFEGIIFPLGMIFGVSTLMILNNFQIEISYFLILGLILVFLIGLFPVKKFYTNISRVKLRSEQDIVSKLHSIEVISQKGHKNSVLTLTQELKNKNHHDIVREKIIRTVSRINDPRAVHHYLEILGDKQESTDLKIQILESLLLLRSLKEYWREHAFSQYHILQILDQCFKNTQNNHLKKLVIMNIFSHLPSHEVVPYFLKILEESDAEMKIICLRSASEIFSDPEVMGYVKKYLTEKDPKLKSYTIISLWKFGIEEELIQHLEDLFQAKKEGIIAAIYAIGETKNKNLEHRIFPFLLDKDPEIKLQALVALAKLNNNSALSPIVEFLFETSQKKLSQKLWRMLKRAHPEFLEALRVEIQFQVSEKVMEILLKENITHREKLGNLSKKLKEQLKYYYRLGEKYEDLVFLEEKA